MSAPDDKASGPIFTGSITFVAMSIPSIALLLTIYDKVVGVSWLRLRMHLLIGLAVIMMVTASVTAVLALARLTGRNVPLPIIVALVCTLMILAPVVTVGTWVAHELSRLAP